MTNIRMSIEEINADLAARFLAKNSQNRPVNALRVKTYAHQMSEGRWQLTGEGIQLSSDGKLLDGQHRLMAIQRVGETQPEFSLPLLVVRGVSAEAFGVIGQGKVRSLADALHIAGHVSTNRLAATVTMHLKITQGDWAATPGDNHQFLRHLEQHPLIETVLPFHAHLEIIPSQTTMLAVFALALEQGVARDSLATFAQGVRTGENLPSGSPILALRLWAVNQRLRKTPATRREIAELYAYALRAHLIGKEVKQIKIVPRDNPFDLKAQS